LTLPFWISLGGADRVVCVIRDPLEVATSLAVRNGLSLDHALMLWNRYTVGVLAAAPEAHVIVHAAIYADPADVVVQLADHLGLPSDDDTLAEAIGAVRPDLYRSRPAEEPSTPTGVFARWLYGVLADGRRPAHALVAALDDAYNGRHLIDAAGVDVQVVTN